MFVKLFILVFRNPSRITCKKLVIDLSTLGVDLLCVGRAGRDGEEAKCTLLVNADDTVQQYSLTQVIMEFFYIT